MRDDSPKSTNSIKILPKCEKYIYQETVMSNNIKNVTACTPTEFLHADGRTYIELPPKHYVLYIPDSIGKEYIIAKIQKPDRKKPIKKRPTRAHNSFILYRTDKVKEIRKKHLDLNQKEVSILAATMWHSESASIREKYKAMYEKNKLEHNSTELGLSMQDSYNQDNQFRDIVKDTLYSNKHLRIELKNDQTNAFKANLQNLDEESFIFSYHSDTRSKVPPIAGFHDSPYSNSKNIFEEYTKINSESQGCFSGESRIENLFTDDFITEKSPIPIPTSNTLKANFKPENILSYNSYYLQSPENTKYNTEKMLIAQPQQQPSQDIRFSLNVTMSPNKNLLNIQESLHQQFSAQNNNSINLNNLQHSSFQYFDQGIDSSAAMINNYLDTNQSTISIDREARMQNLTLLKSLAVENIESNDRLISQYSQQLQTKDINYQFSSFSRNQNNFNSQKNLLNYQIFNPAGTSDFLGLVASTPADCGLISQVSTNQQHPLIFTSSQDMDVETSGNFDLNTYQKLEGGKKHSKPYDFNKH